MKKHLLDAAKVGLLKMMYPFKLEKKKSIYKYQSSEIEIKT